MFIKTIHIFLSASWHSQPRVKSQLQWTREFTSIPSALNKHRRGQDSLSVRGSSSVYFYKTKVSRKERTSQPLFLDSFWTGQEKSVNFFVTLIPYLSPSSQSVAVLVCCVITMFFVCLFVLTATAELFLNKICLAELVARKHSLKKIRKATSKLISLTKQTSETPFCVKRLKLSFIFWVNNLKDFNCIFLHKNKSQPFHIATIFQNPD